MKTMDQLAALWSEAKLREDAAKADRVEIEQQILEQHPAREEGSEIFATPAGAKIKLTGKLTYKVDVDKLVALTCTWPNDIRPVKTEMKADESKLRMIRAQVPKLWADIAPAVTVTPAKTNVAIEFKE